MRALPRGIMVTMAKSSQDSWIYILDDFAMIALALLSAGLLLVEATSTLSPLQVAQIEQIDLGIAVIFLFEFFFKLYASKNKMQYLRSNWWLLLASIPVTSPMTQGLRALRFLRILRLLRLVRVLTGTDAILKYCERFFTQTHVAYVFVIFALSVGTGATLFDYFEFGTNQSVHGYFDSFWWAMVTVSTIGYGDIYPVTVGGRITAMMLMIIGVGLSGVFTAIVASFILRKNHTS
jgi:voltage-gated potassium channel